MDTEEAKRWIASNQISGFNQSFGAWDTLDVTLKESEACPLACKIGKASVSFANPLHKSIFPYNDIQELIGDFEKFTKVLAMPMSLKVDGPSFKSALEQNEILTEENVRPQEEIASFKSTRRT